MLFLVILVLLRMLLLYIIKTISIKNPIKKMSTSKNLKGIFIEKSLFFFAFIFKL